MSVTSSPAPLTLGDAIEAVRRYNRGYYPKAGKLNVDVDDDAYSLFSNGLARSRDEIEIQVRFIGKDYGGVAGQPGAISLVPAIAAAIYENRDNYIHVATTSPSIITACASLDCVKILYGPFVQQYGHSARWQVWGAKFWHFLNPHAFPIEDSRANKFFGLDSMRNSVEKYMKFLSLFRAFVIPRQNWIPDLRQADEGHAKSDNKLWDKVLYSLDESC